jgi:hypothetical protein
MILSIVFWTAAFSSRTERSLFRSAMFFARRSRHPSISARNASSMLAVPFPPFFSFRLST